MPDLDLTTEAGIAAALDRATALRAQADPSLSDDQRWVLEVAVRALRALRPAPQPQEPDTRPVPAWLKRLQAEEDFDARR